MFNRKVSKCSSGHWVSFQTQAKPYMLTNSIINPLTHFLYYFRFNFSRIYLDNLQQVLWTYALSHSALLRTWFPWSVRLKSAISEVALLVVLKFFSQLSVCWHFRLTGHYKTMMNRYLCCKQMTTLNNKLLRSLVFIPFPSFKSVAPYSQFKFNFIVETKTHSMLWRVISNARLQHNNAPVFVGFYVITLFLFFNHRLDLATASRKRKVPACLQ